MKGFLYAFISVSIGLASTSQAELNVVVVDQHNKTVPGAMVMVGQEEGQPFANNIAHTGRSGLASFDAPSLSNTAITVMVSGHPPITYFGQTGDEFIVAIPPALPTKKAKISGKFKNWPRKTSSAQAQVGLLIPFISPAGVFSFQMNDILSTSSDTISAVGQSFEVPSNLVVPRQKLSYGFFNVTLQKDTYRFPVNGPRTLGFSAMSGQFPFKKVVDKMRNGGSALDIINDIKLRAFGTVDNVQLSSTVKHTFDLSQGQLEPCAQVTSRNNPQNLDLLSISLVRDSSATRNFQVTDLKTVGNRGANVLCVKNDQRPISIMNMGLDVDGQTGRNNNRGITSIFARNIPRTSNTQVNLDSYFKVPKVTVSNNGRTVMASRPERQGVSPQATGLFAQLSTVKNHNMGKFSVEEVVPQWVVFAPGNMNKFNLPELPSIAAPSNARRWEVIWLGTEAKYHYNQNFMVSVDLGYDLFETMTHAARNSRDF